MLGRQPPITSRPSSPQHHGHLHGRLFDDGSSIDDLNIRTLSEQSVGDTGGAMSIAAAKTMCSSISPAARNATVNDTLNSTTGTTTIAVKYLVKDRTALQRRPALQFRWVPVQIPRIRSLD